MSGVTSKPKRKVVMRWPEILAGGYLLLFLLIAFAGPVSGLLPRPNAINLDQVYQPPFIFTGITKAQQINWLGTDQLGRDVFSNLVSGARTALQVSLPAMFLATAIGVLLGSLAGFWGNTGLRVGVISFIINFILLLLGIYVSFYIRQTDWLNAFNTGSEPILLEVGITCFIFILLALLGWLLSKMLHQLGFTKQITVPVDQMVLKIIEILGAVPRLLLVMCLTAFSQPALLNLIILAALTYWTGIARLIRGELLQIKELPYIEAARVAGLTDYHILLRHALPNALSPVIVAVAFGLGSLMSLEATLSFLGIGIPAEVPSWGRMMNGIRSNETAWWLLVFPTFALCCTILSIQVVAQYFQRIINPKYK